MSEFHVYANIIYYRVSISKQHTFFMIINVNRFSNFVHFWQILSKFSMCPSLFSVRLTTSRCCVSISLQLSPPARQVGRVLSHLYLRASHTSTLYCPELPTVWFNVFKLFKMLPHVSSLALASASTSRQY